MAVVIRLKRTGRRNRPCYRISVADRRSPRDGRTIDHLGLYDPIAGNPEAQVTLDVERARHWIGVGAQPSDTVRSIFTRLGVYEGAEPRKPRKRSGRKQTAGSLRRKADKAARAERKTARRTERVAARRAAAAAEGGEDQGEE
ncbi:MAG: 30S ribosomal protein S16 [Planctomycetota bacterium]|jgi:small subunit ribosomal protein S16|nr:30S ribosomal protein S16 [Planctomycetota bacterium]MDP6762530.1 30S ribosomal protein S16 [Planctomycetota bacterium]MDP6988107.1 30S ribosomal protein S16 [Planctomycetota bacterium]